MTPNLNSVDFRLDGLLESIEGAFDKSSLDPYPLAM